MTDPTIPISAMAAVTKNLAFAITASTSFAPPYLLAKRFSTLDHLTGGRFGWNIVTGWKKSAFKAIGIDLPIDHDERYRRADEYLRLLYKLWEGSWADDAIISDTEKDEYIDPDRVRQINHYGKYFRLEARHIVDPSPQRTPFLFQAGTSAAGSAFAMAHAEAIFVSGHNPKVIRPKVDNIRRMARENGRDPNSIKFFGTMTPILGRTEEEAREKYLEAKKNASIIGCLVLFSGWTGIDVSQLPLDKEITTSDAKEIHHVVSQLQSLTAPTEQEGFKWTPKTVAEKTSIGGMGPVVIGTSAQVADEIERWVEVADLDGFNVAYVKTPGTFEDVVDLLVPELRRRGVYPESMPEGLTAREKVYGPGQAHVRDDHTAAKYRYDIYKEDSPQVAIANGTPSNEQAADDTSPRKQSRKEQRKSLVSSLLNFGRTSQAAA